MEVTSSECSKISEDQIRMYAESPRFTSSISDKKKFSKCNYLLRNLITTYKYPQCRRQSYLLTG